MVYFYNQLYIHYLSILRTLNSLTLPHDYAANNLGTKPSQSANIITQITFTPTSLRRRILTNPLDQVHETATGGLEQHRASEGRPLETKFSERCVKLNFLFCYRLDFFAEVLEGRLETMSQLSLSLRTYKLISASD